MPHKRGTPRSPGAGRKKGTINKDSVPAKKTAERLGIDLFETLCHFANGDWKALGYSKGTELKSAGAGLTYEVDIITVNHRIAAASEAIQYVMPKRKAIDPPTSELGKVDDDGNAIVEFVDESDHQDAKTNATTVSGG